jgi:hypothetical protein
MSVGTARDSARYVEREFVDASPKRNVVVFKSVDAILKLAKLGRENAQ